MGLRKRAGTRDLGKEQYWRNILKLYAESKQSQAAFCKERGLNQNTFFYWKAVIADRDAEAPRSSKSRKSRATAEAALGAPETPQPVFARFNISDLSAEPCAPPALIVQRETPGVAAELVDASNGRRLRIFNGADQGTIAAVLSALTPLSVGRMGF